MKNNTKRAIYKGVNYLMQMASEKGLSIDALLIEKRDIEHQIAALKEDIANLTPKEADYNEAKSSYQVSLATRKAELNKRNARLAKINADLEKQKKELDSTLELEKTLLKQKGHFDQLINILDDYKNNREFKSYTTDSKQEAEDNTNKLIDVQNKKRRIQSSVNILTEEQEDEEAKIKNCNEDIASLEFILQSNKELENFPTIKEKRDEIAKNKEELAKLQARLDEIISSPEYMEYEIDELIANDADYDLIKEKVLTLYELVRSKPYMSAIIRNNDTTSLKGKKAALEQNISELRGKIAKSNYVLKSLPVEDTRLSDLEKLINSKIKQIEILKNVVDSNSNIILILLRQHRDLKSKYNEEMQQSNDYLKQSEQLDKITQTTLKADYTQHQQLLTYQKELIDNYPDDVQTIIDTNKKLNEFISHLEEQIEAYKAEMKTIVVHQKQRKPIKNYVERAAHENDLKELQKETFYLNKRINFANAKINPTETKNNIIDDLKSLYASQLKAKKAQAREATELKPLESEEIKVTPLKVVPTKEEIKSEIDTFDAIGDLLNKLDLTQKTEETKKTPEIPIDLNIDIDKTVQSIEAKKVETEPVFEPTKLSGVAVDLDLGQLAKEEEKTEEAVETLEGNQQTDVAPKDERPAKIKVINIEPYLKTDVTVENPKYKVVNIEPIKKPNLNKDDTAIYDGIIFRPFVEEEPQLSRVA